MFLWISSTVLNVSLVRKKARRTHRWFNSQRQFLNRLEGGLVELIRSPYIRPPIKSFADVGAGQP